MSLNTAHHDVRIYEPDDSDSKALIGLVLWFTACAFLIYTGLTARPGLPPSGAALGLTAGSRQPPVSVD